MKKVVVCYIMFLAIWFICNKKADTTQQNQPSWSVSWNELKGGTTIGEAKTIVIADGAEYKLEVTGNIPSGVTFKWQVLPSGGILSGGTGRSLVYQAPIAHEQETTIRVKAVFPPGGEGGDEYWAKWNVAIQRPFVNVYLYENTPNDDEAYVLAKNPPSTQKVYGFIGATNLTTDAIKDVPVHWSETHSGEAGTLSANNTNTDGAGVAEVVLTTSTEAGDYHHVTATIKDKDGAESKAAVSPKINIFDVEVTSPTENWTFEIEHDSMQIPSTGIICEAKAVAGETDVTEQVSLTTNWELLLTWTGGGSTYYTPGPTQNDKLSNTDNPFNILATSFRTGGDLSVVVSGTTIGGAYSPRSVDGVTIKVDEDPSNSKFSAQLGANIIRAIAWKEWAGLPTPRWNHYDSNGQPLVHGSDWGIMQIHKPTWEWWFEEPGKTPGGYVVAKWNEMAWNWKTNIANGKYIHQTYMYDRQTSTQKTWPNTADASTPNREDLATYGYHRGCGQMRLITSENWETVEDFHYVEDVRNFKDTKPWEE